jgi:ubiquinone/menaquinone biosynthesis C-methylase UbiE
MPDGALAEKADLRRRYTGYAPAYDRITLIYELPLVRRLRRRLLRRARGKVLEVAAGTGLNLPHYPPECALTLSDMSPAMLLVARQRATALGRTADFAILDGEALPFPAATFDTVVASLSTCSFADPVAALREMARVCRPGGRVLLLEHGRSASPLLGRLQDRLADAWTATVGCRWNRRLLEMLAQAGLRIVQPPDGFGSHTYLFGVFIAVEATP